MSEKTENKVCFECKKEAEPDASKCAHCGAKLGIAYVLSKVPAMIGLVMLAYFFIENLIS